MLDTTCCQRHPAENPACRQMAKAAWNWVELLTGMLLWQQRALPLVYLKTLVDAAVAMQRPPRSTDSDFLDFFQEVCVSACWCGCRRTQHVKGCGRRLPEPSAALGTSVQALETAAAAFHAWAVR